ncbi:MAG: hypothetical protein WCO33_03970 [bacterium]
MNQKHYEEVEKRLDTIKKLLPSNNIVPSILTNDPKLFETQLEVYSKLFKQVEVDVLDNSIIKNKTVPLNEGFEIANKHLSAGTIKTKIGLHFMSSNFDLELVKRNLPIIEEIVFSYEFILSHSEFFDGLLSFTLTNCRPFKIGVYMVPYMGMLDYQKELNLFDFIQLMTVEPGKQGNSFIPEALDSIPILKSMGFKLKLDGGITPEAINSLNEKRRGNLKYVDTISIGSYFAASFK